MFLLLDRPVTQDVLLVPFVLIQVARNVIRVLLVRTMVASELPSVLHVLQDPSVPPTDCHSLLHANLEHTVAVVV